MITKTFIQFFESLAENNYKEWFQDNKKSYECDVKAPFLAIVQGVLDQLPKDQGYPLEAKETLFRINRDVRFSADKTPYHTIIKSSIVEGGKKSERPGIYLAADATTFRIGGGLAMIHPKKMKGVREFVADNIVEFEKLVQTKPFADYFSEIKGEQYKKEDAIAKSAEKSSPLLLNKQFYYMVEYPMQNHLDKDLTPFIMKHVEAAKPLNEFLTEALDYASK